jgi:hypothetical protein
MHAQTIDPPVGVERTQPLEILGIANGGMR